MKKTSALIMSFMLAVGCAGCNSSGGGDQHDIKTESSYEIVSGGSKDETDSNNKYDGIATDNPADKTSEYTPDYVEAVFDKDVLEINITAEPETWQNLLDNAASKPWIKCSVDINGETIKDVGIKTKGNTSLQQLVRQDTERYSLKISFGKYTDGQTFHGLNKLVLNNIYSDSTYLKEYMSYSIMRYMNVPCSLCTFAEIKVNGEHYGFYLALEDTSESFFERVYGESNSVKAYKPDAMDMDKAMNQQANGERPQMPEGMTPPGNGERPQMPEGMTPPGNGERPQMPEGMTPPGNGERPQMPEGMSMPENGERPQMPAGGGADMDGGKKGVDLTYSDDNHDSYSNIFDNAIIDASEEDESRLISSLKALNEGKDIEKCVDVDEVLRYLACNVFIVNLDSYLSSNCHNYILAENNGQLSMLPWDYNLSFGGYGTKSSDDAVNYAIDTVLNGVSAEKRPMITKLLENDEYREKYHNYLKEIAEKFVLSGLFDETADKAVSVIDSYVKADTTSFYGYDAFKEGTEALKLFAKLRAESVKAQLEGTIPSYQADRNEETILIDASSLQFDKLGGMNKQKNTNP